MPTKTADELTRLTERILESAGVVCSVATRVAQHLVESNLAGVDSHGVVRIPSYIRWLQEGRISIQDDVEILTEQEALVLIDGHATFGPVTASRAANMAMQKAIKYGLSMVVARNSAHTGRLGEYVERLARCGFIGLMCCNAQGAGQVVAPWGGREPRLSTNPMAWSIPAEPDPIVIDMATSAVSEGKIRVKLHQQEKLLPGWAIDADGREIREPAAFYGPPWGALLAAGGHKGYGLALVVEALAGALSAGGCVRPVDHVHEPLNSFCMLVIQVDSLRELSDFRKSVCDFATYVKGSEPIQAGGEVLLPYEPELRERRRRLTEGIPIDGSTWSEIVKVANRLGIDTQ